MNQMLPTIVSLSPLRAAVFGWRTAQARMLTLVCKATYTLRPVESPLAAEQDDPNESDDHWDDDPAKSLRAPSDFVPSKPRAEVMVVGSAFSETGTARPRLPVRVIVGELDKALAVIGDRALLPDGSVGDPAPFTKMALRYERAAGGPGTVNPVGVGVDFDAYGKRMLPNIVPLETSSASAIDLEPVGLGPIASRWPLRVARLGSNAAAWAARGDLEVPWPDDFDASYFLSAPWDQRLDALRPNERLVLENLHPTHARLVTSLPGIEPRVFVDVDRGTPHELTMRCDTLWIDTDRGICTLTWRGQLNAERPQPARIIVASSHSGRRLAWADVAPLVRTAPSSSSPPRPPRPPQREPRSEPVDAPTPLDTVDAIDATAPLPGGAAAPALPFVGGTVAAPRASSPALASSALPFIGASPAPAPAAVAAPAPSAAHAPPFARGSAAAAPAIPPAPPSTPPRSEPPKPQLVVEVPSAPPPAASAPPAPSAKPAAPGPAVGVVSSRWDGANRGAKSWFPSRAEGQAAIPTSGVSASPDFSAGSAAAAASNAAAQSAPPPPPAAAVAKVEPLPEPPPPRSLRGAERAFVDLLWFDPVAARRLRTLPAFKAIFAGVPDHGPKPAGDEEEADLRERRDALRVLTSASPLDGEPLRRAIHEQYEDPATFSHPLVVVSGDLAPSFDEVATLKASVQIGSALGGADKRIRDATAVGAEALRGDPPPRETALGFARSIVEAAAKSGGPPINQAITRLLLDQRAFRKRHLFGAPRLRAELSLAGNAAPIPVYLPEAAEATLPCLAKIRVRLLAEVRPQEDYAESAPESLLAFAMGRVLSGT